MHAKVKNAFGRIGTFHFQFQFVMENNFTRPKRLDDFKYIEEPDMTALFMEKLAQTKFHGVSVSIVFVFCFLLFKIILIVQI